MGDRRGQGATSSPCRTSRSSCPLPVGGAGDSGTVKVVVVERRRTTRRRCGPSHGCPSRSRPGSRSLSFASTDETARVRREVAGLGLEDRVKWGRLRQLAPTRPTWRVELAIEGFPSWSSSTDSPAWPWWRPTWHGQILDGAGGCSCGPCPAALADGLVRVIGSAGNIACGATSPRTSPPTRFSHRTRVHLRARRLGVTTGLSMDVKRPSSRKSDIAAALSLPRATHRQIVVAGAAMAVGTFAELLVLAIATLTSLIGTGEEVFGQGRLHLDHLVDRTAVVDRRRLDLVVAPFGSSTLHRGGTWR